MNTVWTLIFAVLNFRGSTAIRESLVPRKFRPAFTEQRIASIFINSDVIILQNGYRGLGRSEHRCGVASNRLCEQTHEILRHMTDRCARFLDRNCKGIFSIASFATAAENLSNTRLAHCPINMKSTNATLDFKHPLSDLRNDNFRSST